MSGGLYAANTPVRFWRLRLEPASSPADWASAVAETLDVLPLKARAADLEAVLGRVLGEAQFGPAHWSLSRARRFYYPVKPLLPRPLIRLLRRPQRARAESSFPRGWPVEDRYARCLWGVVGSQIAKRPTGFAYSPALSGKGGSWKRRSQARYGPCSSVACSRGRVHAGIRRSSVCWVACSGTTLTERPRRLE